jgi:hypothetical protein
MKKFLFSAAVAVLALSSCKKDKASDTLAITKENIVGTYKLTGMDITAAGQTRSIYNETFDACERDDLFAFKAGNIGAYTDAGEKCDLVNEPQEFKWSLNGTTLAVENDEEIGGTISSLTSKQMVVTQTVSAFGISSTTTMTYTRQ